MYAPDLEDMTLELLQPEKRFPVILPFWFEISYPLKRDQLVGNIPLNLQGRRKILLRHL